MCPDLAQGKGLPQQITPNRTVSATVPIVDWNTVRVRFGTGFEIAWIEPKRTRKS